MKIALAQINPTVGAIADNAARIGSTIDRAADLGAELVVFPELAVTGYPPQDLLDHRSFVSANLAALESIAALTAGAGRPGVIVGYIERVDRPGGKSLHNAAALIDGGRVLSRHFKTLLPTYDVFDERRHFEPADRWELGRFRGIKLGVTICEDFWNDRLYWPAPVYPVDPVEKAAELGAELLVNISASPFWLGKDRLRDRMHAAATRRHRLPLVHVNQVGGNDNLIFDGRSNVWGADGRRLAQAKAFEEDLLIVEMPASPDAPEAPAPEMAEEEEAYRALVLGIRDYVRKCGFKRVVVALSGGIDSALTATLAVDALGAGAVTGVAMPSAFSSSHSLEDAEALARNLGMKLHRLPIGPIYDAALAALEPLFEGTEFGVAEENLQARARGNLLMALSNKFGWLALTTGNKSELAVGYCTLYGDMSGGLAVLADVLKTRVYRIARWINRDGERIPRRSIEKAPSAELRPDQFDTDSLPPYEKLDPIIEAYVEKRLSTHEIIEMGVEPELARRIVRAIDRNEYKRRQAPVGLRITGKARWRRRAGRIVCGG
jgi:NAD+ synthase (glutamine-hydrolysing)